MEHFVNRCVSFCLAQLFTVSCAKSAKQLVEWLQKSGSHAGLDLLCETWEQILSCVFCCKMILLFLFFVTAPSRRVSREAIIKCRWQNPQSFAAGLIAHVIMRLIFWWLTVVSYARKWHRPRLKKAERFFDHNSHSWFSCCDLPANDTRR